MTVILDRHRVMSVAIAVTIAVAGLGRNDRLMD